jgi:hypothetical protein
MMMVPSAVEIIYPPIFIVLTVQPSKNRKKGLGDLGDAGGEKLEQISCGKSDCPTVID